MSRSLIFPVICFCALLSVVSGQSGDGTDSEIRSLRYGGLERTYRIHIPPSGKRNKPAPLLLALHGGGGTGKGMQKLAGLNALSDKKGFIAVYPDGVDRHWNDGRKLDYRAQRENVDDVGFIAALIDRLVKDLNADPRRVYVTGMSNGALFAHRLACEIPEKIAAIAPVEGTLLEALSAKCAASVPISALIIKGLDAPLFEKSSKRLSPSDTAKFWAARNHCSSAPIVTWEPDKDPRDGTRVRREAYGPCREGAEVTLYAIEGGGHTWPGGWQYYPKERIGKTSRDINASEVIWEFFSRHSRPARNERQSRSPSEQSGNNADSFMGRNGDCNPVTGLGSPLPVCSEANPCARPGKELGITVLTTSSETPVCRTTQLGRPVFDDGPPLKWRDPAGIDRYACLFRPTGATPASPRPLIVWLHSGVGGKASDIYNHTSIRAKAVNYDLTGDRGRAGFFLLSIQGRNLHYPVQNPRDGRHHDFYYRDLNSPSRNPDIAYVDRLIDELVAQGSVDKQRIYLMGWCNGGFFAQMYGIARHSTPTPGRNRIAAAVAFSAGDPFQNTNRNQAPSCQLDPYPRSTAPIFLIGRACDIIACDEAQAKHLESGGAVLEPGHIVSTWRADLRRKVGNPNVSWRIVAENGNAVETGSPPSQCSQQAAIINHFRWPDGVADGGGIDHEPAMLDFLRKHHLSVK